MTAGIAEYNQPASIIGSVNLSAPTPTDGHTAALGDFGSLHSAFNETNWDRWRNNSAATALASAVRAVPTYSATQTNYNAKGLIVCLNVTAVGGSGGLYLKIRGVDPVTGNTYSLNVDPTIVTNTGTYVYILYPGASSAVDATTSLKQNFAAVLPRNFLVGCYHADATNYTYSIGYSLVV